MTQPIYNQNLPKQPYVIIGMILAVFLAIINSNYRYFSNYWFFYSNALIINFSFIFLLSYQFKALTRLIIFSLIYSLLTSIVTYWTFKNNFDFNLSWLSLFAIYASACFIQAGFEAVANKSSNFYSILFQKSWDLICILFGIALFSLLAWLILHLGAYLCSSIGINYFNYLISKTEFTSFITPLMGVTSLYLLLSYPNCIYLMRQNLLNFCIILLPVLTIIGLIYFLALLSQILTHNINLNTITNYSVVTFIWFGILFVNAVYQDGEHRVKIKYYDFAVKILCVLLLLFSIENMGLFLAKAPSFNATNALTLIVNCLYIAYSLVYTLSQKLGSNKSILFEKTNIVLALFQIALVLMIQNPLTRSLAFFGDFNTFKDSNTFPAPAEIITYDISKAGLKWDKSIKNSPILGYRDSSPLYGCRASTIDKQQNVTTAGELNKHGECVFILNDTVMKTKNFDVLNGNDKHLRWQLPYSSEVNLFTINFSADSNIPINLCRGIYANNIYLGSMIQFNSQCRIVINNSVQVMTLSEILYAKVADK